MVIAVVAALLGLLLPSLGGVRQRAQATGSMSNLRTHVQTMWAYTADYASLPVFADPVEGGVITVGGREIETSYFNEKYMWSAGLADAYYGGQLAHDSFFPPGYPYADIPYSYTISFLARPEFWNRESRRVPYSQWRPVDLSLTAYPADKGMFLNGAQARVGEGRLDVRDTTFEVGVGWVDGSVSRQQYGQLRRPITSGIGRVPGRKTSLYGIPVIHTVDGALGRDR